MNFKAIGFDYGGVIAGVSGPEFKKRITSLLGIEIKTFENVYFKFNHLINSNSLSEEDFWMKICEELGVSDKCADLIKFIKELPRYKINEKMIELVDKLRGNGYKTGLLSNNDLSAATQFKKTGLANHFNIVVVSAEIGFSKPHPKAFEIFAEQLGVTTDELVYIDDSERNLAAAKEVGFYPILFTDYESLLDSLKTAGINI